MLINEGEKIKDRVREFFAKGHKSSNKLYHVDIKGRTTTWPMDAKGTKRRNECLESRKHRPSGSNTDYKLAEQLVKMKLVDRSGNCGEMAALSAYYALKIHLIKRDFIYIGSIYDKGDHAFCLIAQAPLKTSELDFASVKEATELRAAKSWLIIDPWLNTVCNADDYLNKTGTKLDEWAGDGKRVSWHGGSLGKGWYVPNGEYKTEFGQAPLFLEGF